jgi:hypothetical protein
MWAVFDLILLLDVGQTAKSLPSNQTAVPDAMTLQSTL